MTQMTFDGLIDNEAGTAAAPIRESLGERAAWYDARPLSHSSIQLYRTCPQRWKFKYVDKVPERSKSFFSFGKSVHAGLEFVFSRLTGQPPSIDEVLAFYKANWLSDGYDSSAQEKWFFQEGERILRGFVIKHQSASAQVLEVELHFTVTVEGIPVTGFIDRIDRTPSGSLAIIDYKTGKPFDKSRVRSDPQLTLYQIAAREILRKPVETVTLYHLNSLTPLTVPAHSADLENKFRGAVVETARGIVEKRFDPKPEERGHCQWCDYRQICPAFVGKATEASSNATALAEAGRLTDRMGKIDQRLRDMTQERDGVSEALAQLMTSLGVATVTGDHFVAELEKMGDGFRCVVRSKSELA